MSVRVGRKSRVAVGAQRVHVLAEVLQRLISSKIRVRFKTFANQRVVNTPPHEFRVSSFLPKRSNLTGAMTRKTTVCNRDETPGPWDCHQFDFRRWSLFGYLVGSQLGRAHHGLRTGTSLPLWQSLIWKTVSGYAPRRAPQYLWTACHIYKNRYRIWTLVDYCSRVFEFTGRVFFPRLSTRDVLFALWVPTHVPKLSDTCKWCQSPDIAGIAN